MLPANRFQIHNLFGYGKSVESNAPVEHKLERTIKELGLLFMIITLTFVIFIYFSVPGGDGRRLNSVRILVGTLNLAILSGLYVVNFFAYRLYRDTFYYLISLNWLFIALGLSCQVVFFLNSNGNPEYRNPVLYLTISILSVASNVPLLLAVILSQNISIKNSKTIKLPSTKTLKLFLTWFAITLLIFFIFIQIPGVNKELAFLIAQTPLSVWVFVTIGQEIKKRLESVAFLEAVTYLSISFYLFGILQVLFLANLWYIQSLPLGVVLATISLFIKVLNLASLFILLGDKYNRAIVLEGAGRSSLNLEHEIGTPLTIISGELYNIKNKIPGTDKEKSIEKIETFINKITNSLDLILYLRTDIFPDDGFMKQANIEDVVNSAVEDAIEKKEKLAQDVNFTVSFSQKIDAYIYPYGIQQAISNILRNSIEAVSEADRPERNIKINTNSNQQNPSEIEITILDNGIGIPSKDTAKVLHGSYSTKRNGKSNRGNGFSMAKRIIEKHDGKINIESKEGEYTKIIINLPNKSVAD